MMQITNVRYYRGTVVMMHITNVRYYRGTVSMMQITNGRDRGCMAACQTPTVRTLPRVPMHVRTHTYAHVW